MNREQLEHAIRAVSDVADIKEMVVIGSQAILGQFPDAPAVLRRSIEVDIIPIANLAATDGIAGALGELSQFHATHDFYVDAVGPETARLPSGWETRLVAVRSEGTRGATGLCLEVGDIAASKLMAFREKDQEYVRALLTERLLKADVLVSRLKSIAASSDELQQRLDWVSRQGIQAKD